MSLASSLSLSIVNTAEAGIRGGLPDTEIERSLIRLGCTRVQHGPRMVTAYYRDEEGVELFVIVAPFPIDRQLPLD